MIPLIRPELRAELRRSRELVTGLVTGLAGLWVFLNAHGLLVWIGAAVLAVGVALCFVGAQRRRFRQRDDGPGVVDVTEGQVSYFGPLDGGIVAISALQELQLSNEGYPAHWVLRQEGGRPLYIPVTAAGADALFDAFALLPGLDTAAMLRALELQGSRTQVIWRRPSYRLG